MEHGTEANREVGVGIFAPREYGDILKEEKGNEMKEGKRTEKYRNKQTGSGASAKERKEKYCRRINTHLLTLPLESGSSSSLGDACCS